MLKKPLRKLLHDQGNLHDRVIKLRKELDEVQIALDRNPNDISLRDEEAVYVQAFTDAKLDEERFLKQKAKVAWLEAGDANSAHYENFLGNCTACELLDDTDLFLNKVLEAANSNMVQDITNEEVKAAMFGIGDDRAPGPDGYTSAFFKKGWDIVGMDVCNAIRGFFSNGPILKEINHTFIALIPKVTTPLKVNDYRPIS
ncbi:hypothetical protein Tco_0120550, partial [Tanacetum coccineum]